MALGRYRSGMVSSITPRGHTCTLSGALSLRSIRSSASVASGIKPQSRTPAPAYAHDIEPGESRYSKLRLHTPKVSHQPLRQTPLPIPHGASAHVQSYHRRARCSRNTEAQCSAPETRAQTLIRPAAVRTLARHGVGPEASMTASNDLRHVEFNLFPMTGSFRLSFRLSF